MIQEFILCVKLLHLEIRSIVLMSSRKLGSWMRAFESGHLRPKIMTKRETPSAFFELRNQLKKDLLPSITVGRSFWLLSKITSILRVLYAVYHLWPFRASLVNDRTFQNFRVDNLIPELCSFAVPSLPSSAKSSAC